MSELHDLLASEAGREPSASGPPFETIVARSRRRRTTRVLSAVVAVLVVTAIAVVASAVRGRRYLHRSGPLLEELAEGAAESAAVYGLDETAGLPGLQARDPAGRRPNGTPVRSPADTELDPSRGSG